LDRSRAHGQRSIALELEAVKAITAIRKNMDKMDALEDAFVDAVGARKLRIQAEMESVYANCRDLALDLQQKYVFFDTWNHVPASECQRN
jgi:hypothetical protein